MRIISGKWKGKLLSNLGDGDASSHLRPTSDRARETIFNMLRHPRYPILNDAQILDIFAGTGALGFEALSRGAKSCHFIENGQRSLQLLRSNMRLLNAEGEILETDALNIDNSKIRKPDFIFLDPPYNQSLGEKAINYLIEKGCNLSGTIIIWEDETPPLAPPALKLIDQRRIGRALVSIFEGKSK